MKTAKACVWSVLGFAAALSLCADTKTWTGGAGDSLASSANNWSPSGAPASGDALVFPNSSAVNVVNNLSGYSYSGITVSGSAPVSFQNSGQAFTLTGDIVITGSRELNLSVPVTLDSAVTFNISNASFYAYGPITGTGGITVIGGRDFYAKDAVALTNGVTVNNGRLRIEKSTFTAPVTLNQLRVGGTTCVSLYFQNSGTYNVPITITSVDGSGYTLNAPAGVGVTNTAQITLGPSAYTRWKPDGSVTYAGGIVLQAPLTGNSMSIVFNGNNVISGVPLAFSNWLYFDNGTLRLAVASNKYAGVKCFTKTLYTDVPYALDPDRTINFGVGYSKNGALDLNGNDQMINRPVLDNTDALDTSSYVLTSTAKPALLRCLATAGTTFFGSLDGALSLSWEPASSAHTLTVTGRTSQTTGSLLVSAGTLHLAGGSSFPNLSGLTATNTGVLRVETANVVAAPLTLANSAQLSLPAGLALACLTANVDGNVLTAGVYSASSTVNGRAFIAGGGTLTVLAAPLSGTVRTWTGAGADNRFSTAANWDSEPAFDGSETLLFSSAGSTGVVDSVVRAGALRFNRGTPFAVLPADASSALRLGLGGITTLAPVAGTPVTHSLAVPLELSHVSEIQVASNQLLAVSARVSGGLPNAALIKSGAGTLGMTGTNTFESPLIISNGYVRVNNGTALGNPTNTISIVRTVNPSDNWNERGFLYFTDASATNNRPLLFDASIYFIGQIYPKNGTLVLNGKVTFLGGGRIDNQGTLVFRGGFWCANADPWLQTAGGNIMRFEQRPLDFGTHPVPVDNGGTFLVSVVSNTWASVSLSSGTFLCGAENVMPTNAFVSFGRSWTQVGFVDLNGFNQQQKFLTYSAGSTSATNMAVKSTAPATLTLQGDAAVWPFVGYFSGKASLRHRNTGTLAFTGPSSASTTAGSLLIEAGTVSFRSGASWTGSTNITVTSGTLSVEGGSGATFGGSSANANKTRLHLASTATVNLAAGVTDSVYALTLDGKHQPIGTYGSATSAAQHKSARFTGTGVLNVLRSEIPGTLISVR